MPSSSRRRYYPTWPSSFFCGQGRIAAIVTVNHRKEIVVGSRGSTLALWQTEYVIRRLQQLRPDLTFTMKRIKTEGDQSPDVPLAAVGSRGVFVKEIEAALLAGEIDLAVHSLKDLPSQTTAGLTLAAIPEREDARDVFISRHGCRLLDLPQGARVGTSSPRRAAQVLALRPDLQIVNLRGNVDTRLRKAETDAYDGVVVAAAGLRRLGYEDRVTEYLSFEVCLPAPGQGALAVETRAGDEEIVELASPLDDAATRQAVAAERALILALGGGCQTPIGAYAYVRESTLELAGVVASPDGRRIIRGRVIGDSADPLALGRELAGRLIANGAVDIIESTKGC